MAPTSHRSSQPKGLHTDLYELRMAQTCLRKGLTQQATFGLFIRRDERRPWLLAGGVQRALELIAGFTYGDAELAYLRQLGFADEVLYWLARLEAAGEVWAVPEGTVVLADEPLLKVTAPLPGDAVGDRPDERDAADHGAGDQGGTLPHRGWGRDAQRLRVPARPGPGDRGGGRAGHLPRRVRLHLQRRGRTPPPHPGHRDDGPFVRAGPRRRDHPDHSVLLVDTYDTMEGVRRAIQVGRRLRDRGGDLKGVRLDSGDLADHARGARGALDDAGFTDTTIIASGGIDEFQIAALAASGVPIDGFGVGTSLTVSTDRPALDIVYKPVAYDGRPRAKYREGKVLLPGAKQVHRDGPSDSDVLSTRDEPSPRAQSLLATRVAGRQPPVHV